MIPSRKERVRQAYLGNGLNIGEVHAYAEKVMEDRLHDDARREITTEAVLKKDAKVYGVIKSTVLTKAISSER